MDTAEIVKLQDGESPIDFMNRKAAEIAARNQPQSAPRDAGVVNAPAEPAPTSQTLAQDPPPVTNTDEFTPDIPKVQTKTPQNEPVIPQNTQDLSVDDLLAQPDDDENIGKLAVKENFRKLKGNLKETKGVLSTREKELSEERTKREAYERGELVPEVYLSQQQRLQELEKYEKIHGLKRSEGYKKTILEPWEAVTDKLEQFESAYKLDPSVIKAALDIENSAELNRFLSQKLDVLGATELKGLLQQAKELQVKAAEAEKEPASMLERLEQEVNASREIEDTTRKQAIAHVAKSTWASTIAKMRDEGSAAALLIKDGDPEYVEKHVNPMFTKAAVDFGRITKILAENGLKKMPEEVAEFLAKMTLLAHDSALSSKINEALRAENNETKAAAKRFNPLLRPQVGVRSSVPVSPPPQQGESKNLVEVSRNHLNSILQKSH